MKKLIVALLLGSFLAYAAEELPRIPDNVGVRIRNVQLDQARLQNQVAQLQAQYQNVQRALADDDKQLESLKTVALTSANLDAARYDVDLEKLTFIAKPEPPKDKK